LSLIDKEAQTCIDALNGRPELKHYKEDAQALKNMDSLYKSNVFGGSVFSPIGRLNK